MWLNHRGSDSDILNESYVPFKSMSDSELYSDSESVQDWEVCQTWNFIQKVFRLENPNHFCDCVFCGYKEFHV